MIIYVTQERPVDIGTHEPTGRWRTEPVDIDRLRDYTRERAYWRAEDTNHRSFQREARIVALAIEAPEVVDAYQPTVIAGGDLNWAPDA